MAVRAYPNYRDSGIKWIGDVPSHWKMRRLKEVGRLVAGAGFPEALQGVEDEELPFFKVADLENASHGRWMIRGDHSISRETATDIRARVIPAGSVVYAKIGAALLLNRRRVTTVPCCIDNNMSAFVPFPDIVTTEWALSSLSLLDFRRYVNPGAVPSLSEGDQSLLPFPLPPVDEQRTISALLDRETERIDGLVEKKRLLIERLEEYRTALITRTVTRGLPPEAARAAGLDPSPRLKPSGVKWLGEVPEHWEISRLSRVISCLDGRRVPLNAEQRGDFQGEYPYWGANGILDHIAGWLFDEPLVLLGEDGAPFFDTNKRVAFSVSGKIWVNNHAHVLRPTGIHPEFLTHVLNITEFAFFIDGSTRDKLTQGQMNSIPVPLPPLREQHEISMFLHQEAGRIDSLVELVETNIERLNEHRTAVITAAVTGKIDVRESAQVTANAMSA